MVVKVSQETSWCTNAETFSGLQQAKMGDADLFDQFVSTRVCIRSKKWWWPVFTWAVNTSMENAWDLFRTVQMQRIGMLNFQREVVMTILQSFKRNKPAKSRTFPRNVASNVKLDTKNHIFVKILIVTVNTVVVDQSIYSRNAMLSYIPTVSKTIIHETQNFLYCFLPEVLIM